MRRFLHRLLILSLMASPVVAHEFWLEPLDFQIDSEAPIQANIKIGQYFKGSIYSYIPDRFERFELVANGTATPVQSRLGDRPAINQTLSTDGLVIAAYESTYDYLTYDDSETFRNFLQLDGLTWVAARHRERNLPPDGFTEAYRRFAKAYVGVDGSQGQDQPMGYPLEWMLLDNPYRLTAGRPLTAQLLWQGKPMANTLARVFVRQDGDVEEWRLTTSEVGQVTLPYRKDADYLVSSVHMIEATEATNPRKEAVWESLWASAVFHRP